MDRTLPDDEEKNETFHSCIADVKCPTCCSFLQFEKRAALSYLDLRAIKGTCHCCVHRSKLRRFIIQIMLFCCWQLIGSVKSDRRHFVADKSIFFCNGGCVCWPFLLDLR